MESTVESEKYKSSRILESLLRIAIFVLSGAAFTWAFFGSLLSGAAIGFGVYLAFTLTGIFSELMAIHRELASFRSADEGD